MKGKVIVMTLDTLRAEKRAEILRLAELHGCRNVRVFGSVASGENKPGSDVDFLVDLENGRGLLDLGRTLRAGAATPYSRAKRDRGRSVRPPGSGPHSPTP